MQKIPVFAFTSDGFGPRLIFFGVQIEFETITADAFHARTPIQTGERLTACIRERNTGFTQYPMDPTGVQLITDCALEVGGVILQSIQFRRLT
jgi:hypothetical protein